MTKPGRPIDVFCKNRDAASLFRALRLCGLGKASALDLTSRITGVNPTAVRKHDLKNRDYRDKSNRKALFSLEAASPESEIINAKAALIKHNWIEPAITVGVVKLLNSYHE